MLENYAVASGGNEAMKSAYNPTVGENIDRRIAALEDEIKRLTDLKEKLQSPSGLLFVPIEDLRRAMMY